ncbi:MAG TPA: hypothetical protein PLJ69_10705 [Methanothrix sp.]|jgi:hypothetical protein|nr:hypothetical protein [Methanothrix sp.]
MRMKERYRVEIAAGVCFLLAGIALTFLEVWPEEPMTPFCYLAPVGLALIMIPLVRSWRYGDEPHKDERTDGISTRGFVYSWHLTVGVMVALFVMDDAGVMTMTVQNTLALTILVATFSALIFQWHISRTEANL